VALHKEKEMSAERIKEVARLIKKFIDSEGRELAFDEKRTIVEMLVDEIVVRFNEDSVEVTAIGALDELKRQRLLQHCHDVHSGSQPQDIVNNTLCKERQTAIVISSGFKLVRLSQNNKKTIVENKKRNMTFLFQT
jgi:site-specific DNA recombinase